MTRQQILLIGGAVLLGSLGNVVNKIKNAREVKTLFDKIDFLIHFVIALIAGVAFVLACKAYRSSDILVISLCGMAGGVLGYDNMVNMIEGLFKIISSKKPKSLDTNNNEND